MKTVNIVIIEDNKIDYEITKRKLHYLAPTASLVHFSNAADALDYLFIIGKYAGDAGYIKPDIIILDILMPDVNGMDVLKKINTEGSEALKNIPIIILSNLDDTATNKESFALGAKAYLIKPLQTEQLRDYFIQFGFND